MSAKKFVLVVVPSRENAYHNLKDFSAVLVPIGIATIAAILEAKGYKVTIIDADAENLDLDETLRRTVLEQPDYVGSTTMTATMDITTRFYAHLRERLPEVVIIAGGPHVSALPGETLEEVPAIDIVVKGEGDDTIAELMGALENKQDLASIKGIAFRKDGLIIKTPDRELIEDLGKLPMPAYHLLKYDLYRSYGWNNWVSGYRKPFGSVFAGRGCYGKCNFCATKTIFGDKMRFFPPERVKKEIDFLVRTYNIRVLYFLDDTFTANRRMVNEICDHLIEKGHSKKIEIMVSSRTDTIHLPTLKKMREAGVRWICFGVESGSQKILDIMRKRTTLSQIRHAFRTANEAGLFVSGNYMLGHLEETRETAMETIQLACEMRQDFAAFAIAIPLPGTGLYQYCLDNKIKLPAWNDFGSVNTPPIPLNASLDAEQLIKLRRIAINRFFKRPGYLLRILLRFNALAVIGDFFRMYFAFKKEVAAKRC